MGDGGSNLQSSGEVVLGKGQVPCEFQADQTKCLVCSWSWTQGCLSRALPRMVPHPWPAAMDVIWHIYSGQYCFKRDVGMDLLSSGEVTLTMGQVPVSFEQIGPGSFFRENWDKGPNSPASPVCQSGAPRVAPDMIWHIYSGRAASRRIEVWTCHLQVRLSSPWSRSSVSSEWIGHG